MGNKQNGHGRPGAARSLNTRLLVRHGGRLLIDTTFAELIVRGHLQQWAPLLDVRDLVIEVQPPLD